MIDREDVSQLASEVADTAASKGIAVSLSGWRNVQAARATAEAHIDLSGRDELAAHLGRISLCGSQRPHAEAPRRGIAFAVEDEAALQRMERLAKGKRGAVGEEITWFGPLWLPAWSLRLGLVRDEGHLDRVPRVARVWNDYEALTGRFTYGTSVPQILVDVELARGYVRPILKASKVKELLGRDLDELASRDHLHGQEASRRHAHHDGNSAPVPRAGDRGDDADLRSPLGGVHVQG